MYKEEKKIELLNKNDDRNFCFQNDNITLLLYFL